MNLYFTNLGFNPEIVVLKFKNNGKRYFTNLNDAATHIESFRFQNLTWECGSIINIFNAGVIVGKILPIRPLNTLEKQHINSSLITFLSKLWKCEANKETVYHICQLDDFRREIYLAKTYGTANP